MGQVALYGPVGVEDKRLAAAERNLAEVAEREVRLFKTPGQTELSQLAFGSTAHSLWVKDKKEGSQVVCVDQCRLPGIEASWES